MSIYYVDVNVNESGQHIVHEEHCDKLPDEMERTYLGEFVNEFEAVEAAVRNCYPNSDGCYFCCNEAHKF